MKVSSSAGSFTVTPLDLETVHMRCEDLAVNGLHYVMYGPLYWVDRRWSCFPVGHSRSGDPPMTLLRHDDMRRQGSHAAYRKAGLVVEQVANDWMPSAAKFEALVIDNLKRQLAQAIVELA